MGGVLLVIVIGLAIIVLAVAHRRGWFNGESNAPPAPEPSPRQLPRRRRVWPPELNDETEFRGPQVNTAAPKTQPMGRRTSVGTVFEEVVALLTIYGLGEWLFVDVDERVTGASPLKAETGYYVRVTVDSEAPNGYAIERMPASQYLNLRSGKQDIHVFFVRADTDLVVQGASVVEIPPPDKSLTWHIPTPDHSVRPITRFPMSSEVGRMDAMRLAAQVIRAKRLE